MNAEKYTQKSLEAIKEAQNIKREYGNSQIEQAHILKALFDVDESLIKELFTKMNIGDDFQNDCTRLISNFPKMSGGNYNDNLYIAPDVDKLLTESEKIAKNMKDDYVSVEHIMLSFFDNGNKDIKDLFAKYKLNKNAFLKALSSVRGNTRVATDNPEATYNVLEKYGQDLVEMARQQKLDPVIGSNLFF